MHNVLVAVAALCLFIGGGIGWRLRGSDNEARGDIHSGPDDVEARARRVQ